MFIGIEIPLGLAFTYPFLNLIQNKYLRPTVENEISHLCNIHNYMIIYERRIEYDSPIYFNVNSVIIPLSGGNAMKYHFLVSKLIGKNQFNKDFTNYKRIDKKSENYEATYYINTYDELNNILEHYNINKKSLSITLPLMVDTYKYPKGLFIHPLGYISNNKQSLVKNILWRKRLPGTIRITALAATGLLCCWIYYALDRPLHYPQKYYPPFHPKRYSVH
jgi:hypothetical protein